MRDPQTKETIDQALALWFPGPQSETGEDTAELQLHGGRAVIAATLDALGKLEGLRPAEAGEFTRRAFENGKLDLTAVEGLADLVMAETQGQRRQALRQLQGALGGRAEAWRAQLIQALALVEARIDFSDEADVPEDLVAPALVVARSLAEEIAGALADERRGERLRDGLTVAIAGPVNAGKSTLLNRIARREAAIVSPYAGTTRDVIEVHLDLDGWPVTLLDTAGMRETGDPVEMEGVRRARERAAAADLLLWVVDASEPELAGPLLGAEGALPGSGSDVSPVIAGRERSERTRNPGAGVEAALGQTGSACDVSPGNADGAPTFTSYKWPAVWLVRNKIDIAQQGLGKNESGILDDHKNEHRYATNKLLKNMVNNLLTDSNEYRFNEYESEFNISAASGQGVEPLLLAIFTYAERILSGAEQALVTRGRHRKALQYTLAALRRALAPDLAGHEDLLAEELRAAALALGRLTGRVDVEDILDVIFRDFCIGK